MNILFTVTYYLFVIHLVRVIIQWLHLWQVKEYRLDRMMVHFKETRQGKNIFFGVEPLVKIGIIIVYFYSIFNSEIYIIVPFAVCGIYLYELVKLGIDLLQKKVKFPLFTPKLILIALATLGLVFLLLLLPLLDKFFWLVFVDKFVIFIIAGFMGLFSFPSIFYKDTQINKAITKLRKHKKIKVIGITGSYGKGSTKEYMYSIISHSLPTIKTPSTHNTPIGIARTVLSKLNSKTKVFIVEMGAYKIGEIAEMCSFVQPSIGVLTAVNDQHVSLFGSIENTKKAKYEIIDTLPSNGIALFNGNNAIVKELYKNSNKKNKYLYMVGEKNIEKADIFAHNVVVHPTFVTCDVSIGKEKIKDLKVDVVGAHHLQNIIPGIFVARILKISEDKIKSGLQTIRPLYKTMQPFISKDKKIVLVDDTYNANPASVMSAIEYLSHQKGKKALVLQPMIELGKHAKEDHYMIGKEAGRVCDALYLTNNNFYAELSSGISDSGSSCTITVLSPKKIADQITKEYGEEDTVVFEGKESQASIDLIAREAVYTPNG
jgi:UDP-N-acetylmuramoyl-tripeptide--D-alanyl-D-alanine ligase